MPCNAIARLVARLPAPIKTTVDILSNL